MIKFKKKTRSFIEGYKRKNVIDLIESFKYNGYIPVEKIQVKEIGYNQYLVLEGNRRITVLKILFEEYEQNHDIGKLDPNIFSSLKDFVEIHNQEAEQTHMLVMGLKHIGSNKKWPSINQAKFMRDYLKKFDGSLYEAEDSVCDTLGITKQKLRRYIRALSLIEQYQKSDYGDQFYNDKFSLFEEIIKSPDIRDWIEWNEENLKAENNINLERLFNWISYIEEYDEENDEEIKKEPIITKSTEIRQLKVLLNLVIIRFWFFIGQTRTMVTLFTPPQPGIFMEFIPITIILVWLRMELMCLNILLEALAQVRAIRRAGH
jgi:hypothetical protein